MAPGSLNIGNVSWMSTYRQGFRSAIGDLAALTLLTNQKLSKCDRQSSRWPEHWESILDGRGLCDSSLWGYNCYYVWRWSTQCCILWTFSRIAQGNSELIFNTYLAKKNSHFWNFISLQNRSNKVCNKVLDHWDWSVMKWRLLVSVMAETSMWAKLWLTRDCRSRCQAREYWQFRKNVYIYKDMKIH